SFGISCSRSTSGRPYAMVASAWAFASASGSRASMNVHDVNSSRQRARTPSGMYEWQKRTVSAIVACSVYSWDGLPGPSLQQDGPGRPSHEFESLIRNLHPQLLRQRHELSPRAVVDANPRLQPLGLRAPLRVAGERDLAHPLGT